MSALFPDIAVSERRIAALHHSRSLHLLADGDVDGAIHHCRHAIAAQPDHTEAHHRLGLCLLRTGDYAQGWPEYEWRPQKPLRSDRPRWAGEALAGRTILLLHEQGYGDAIQFIRFAAPLAERGARVVVAALPKLAALFRTCPGVSDVITRIDELPAHDFWLPLPSVPGLIGTTLATIPALCPYLTPDTERAERWRRFFKEQGGGVRIGICWAGNPGHPSDSRRSIPVAVLAPLLNAAPGVRWYSLQFGERADDLEQLPGGLVVDLSSRLGGFDETAAAIAALDLVITCDTVTAHLAGAMGRPVWIALAHVAGWQWLRERSDSPWYPSATLFRQDRAGDWQGVFRRIARRLKPFVKDRRP